MTDIDAKDNSGLAQDRRVKYAWRALLCVCAATVMGSVLILMLPSLRGGIIHWAGVHLAHKTLNAPVWHGRFVRWARWAIALSMVSLLLVAMFLAKRFEDNKAKWRTFAVGCLIVMSIVIISNTSMVTYGRVEGDSQVFVTVAMQMRNGLMPYRDIFDHKGPLLYILDFIGLSLTQGSTKGILFIEFISSFVASLALYKIARIYCNKVASLIATALSLITFISNLQDTFVGGNLTEEYAVPFITWGLWVFIEYFQFGRVSKRRLALCGLCFGGVCMLRPNMVAVWAVFCIAVLVKCLREKRYTDIYHFLLWFMAGFALIVLPIVLWLALNGALKDAIDCYLVFNKDYIAYFGHGHRGYHLFLYIANNNYVIMSVIVLAYLWLLEKKTFAFVHLMYLFVTLVCCSLSGAITEHYAIVLTPAILYPTVELLHLLEKRAMVNDKEAVILVAVAIYSISRAPVIDMLKSYQLPERSVASRYKEEDAISQFIMENTTNDDKILGVGWCVSNYFYVNTGRMPASRFAYQLPIVQIRTKERDEFYSEIIENKPKVVAVDRNNANDVRKECPRLFGLLSSSRYKKVDCITGLQYYDVYLLSEDTSHD